MKNIQKIIEDYYGLEAGSIKLPTRKRNIITARQISMYFYRQMTAHTLEMIGLQHGGKGHVTVLQSIRKVKDIASVDKRFARELKDIESILNRL